MRGNRKYALTLAALLAAGSVGCQSYQARRPILSTEPPMAAAEGDPAGAATAPRTASFADRHPLFYKPREYWDTSGNNTIVKVAAATFVGVPAGILGEMRQIIVGSPATPRY